jgi:hypothetical protein
MTERYSRRSIIKSSVYTGAIAGFGVKEFTTKARGASFDTGPSADTSSHLFRFVDSGFNREKTTVDIRKKKTGETVKQFQLKTVGTNHPEMRKKSHKRRFPSVAADINSFGIPPGKYEIKLIQGDLSGKTSFTMSDRGLGYGDKISALLLPNDKLKLNILHCD